MIAYVIGMVACEHRGNGEALPARGAVHDEEDWKLISALLGERETLRIEARYTAPPTEQTLFDV
ncbi:MAG TPA: hypothetical protein VNP04_06925 [Alphaproteobacteria bacterium]|nr:hypothetical protein [Alphaproteobacteria bacterium]